MSTDLPLVSIVTPSLDQGRFIRSAIDSVLAQTYPRIEYLVVDGGSADQTLEILESYGDRLQWSSGPDDGQTDAIHTGFEQSTGEILAWLNADDVYEPNAVADAVDAFRHDQSVGLVYGPGSIIDVNGDPAGPFVGHEPFDRWRLIHVLDYILQPTTFFRRDQYFATGGLDTSLDWTMDWDLWIRLAAISEVECLDRTLATSREYSETKTASGGWRRISEIGRVAKRRAGRFWTPGVKLYALDTFRRQGLRATPWLTRPINSVVARCSRRIIEGVGVHADGWHGPRSAVLIPAAHRSVELELEILQLPKNGPLIIELEVGGDLLDPIQIDQIGRSSHRTSIPTETAELFHHLDLSCNFWFRGEGDRRRLAFRCLSISSQP